MGSEHDWKYSKTIAEYKCQKMICYGHIFGAGKRPYMSGECNKGQPQKDGQALREITDLSGLAARLTQDRQQWEKNVRHVTDPTLNDNL